MVKAMREILFRGSVGTGKWVYGDLLHGKRKTALICSNKTVIPFEVISETVGQYTGLDDKNGVKIFEGDIVLLSECEYPSKVEWSCGLSGFFIETNHSHLELASYLHHRLEVIGNIYDNPELLK